MELTLSEKRRKARMSWGWTSERRAKLAAMRTRMIADGTISAPPASLGGKARALLAKEQYGGDCMSPEARTRQLETQRRQFETGERIIAPQTREAVRQANLRRSDDIGRMNRERIWTQDMRQKLSATRRTKFASGELTISAHTRAQISAANKGKPHPWMRGKPSPAKRPGVGAKISATLMGHPRYPQSPEALERLRERMLKANPFKGKKHDKETRRKISLSVRAAYAHNPSLARASAERIVKIRPHESRRPDWRERSRASNKRWAADPENNNRRARAARVAACQRPNGFEADVMAFLDRRFLLEWRYNIADLAVGGKIPDFIRRDDRRVCIDAFGDFWHRGDSPRRRQAFFRLHGYRLVVIWEREFRQDPETLARRIFIAMRRMK